MWPTAKAWGYVARNIMEGVVLPSSKRRQRFFASQQQIQLIVTSAKEPYRTFYGPAAETGLRPGELCGYTLDDLDLERGMLQVRQRAWRGKLGDPKTKDSIRVVELSPQACVHLKRFLASWRPNDRRLLFATGNGTPWDQNMVLKRKFKPLIDGTRHHGAAARRWLLHSATWERDVDEQLRGSPEIAPTTARPRTRLTDHGIGSYPCNQ
jgi:integrase